MSRKVKFSEEVKLEVVIKYINGESPTELSRKYECSKTEMTKWINTYKEYGKDALKVTNGNKSYSVEFKAMVVEEYAKGGIGLKPLAIKYKIPSHRQILRWIKMYNSHEGNLKAYKPNGGITMTKGIKTTFEERIEVVEYCLKNGENYNAAALKFNVSYNQIYSWVNKYNKYGVAALKDNRGKGKALEDMNKVEALEAENKLLKAKLAHLEMEADLKKKLHEVQMRLESAMQNKK